MGCPAVAGMTPTLAQAFTATMGLPRGRGDDAELHCWPLASRWFAPRARGCCCDHPLAHPPHAGCPTAPASLSDSATRQVAPRVRGCHVGLPQTGYALGGCPARAGMLLYRRTPRTYRLWLPCVRGDVVALLVGAGRGLRVAPRARGCRLRYRQRTRWDCLACARVLQGRQRGLRLPRRLPSVRGGGDVFSPCGAGYSSFVRLPRIRGDVAVASTPPLPVVAPRARGCRVHRAGAVNVARARWQGQRLGLRGFPACAGGVAYDNPKQAPSAGFPACAGGVAEMSL